MTTDSWGCHSLKMDEITKQISCVDAVNSLFHCYGAWHQFDRYYKDGKFDDCERQRQELIMCVRLKAGSHEDQKALLKQLVKDGTSPTEGVVWEPKDIQSQVHGKQDGAAPPSTGQR